jgi:nucleotide-binding universal stress UspA family protein
MMGFGIPHLVRSRNRRVGPACRAIPSALVGQVAFPLGFAAVVTVADDGAEAFETASRGCALLDKLGVRAVPDNLVSTESTAGALLLHRARIGAGMIAVGGYIPSSLARLMWGSVTQDVVEHAAVPVFLHY